MDHSQHTMKMDDTLLFWQRFKMSMTMTMGMDHTGLSGRAMAKMMELDIRRKFFFSLILAIPIILYSPVGEQLLGLHLPAPIPVPWILFILTTPVYFYAGWIFLYSSYHALKQRTLNMAVLIAVGITAAYAFSVYLTLTGGKDSFYEAAALLITFVLFGHWMEMKSRRGTTDALQALFDLVPPKARLLKNGKEVLVATSVIKVGDVLILKPGDKVPVDGTITTGETSVDEALVTGESLPVVKTVGDRLIAGSINDSGSVRFSATKVGNDTALAQIVKMVETAQNSKAPGQRLADRFAGYLVIVAISAGIITFAVWIIAGFSVIFALTLAISAIVIACPDALGLATPTAVAVGTGMGARHNILIKDASTLEQTSKIQAVVMDKTGTLTDGKPRVTDVITANDFSDIDVLRLTAAAEVSSNHPLSKAVIDAVKEKKAVIPSDIKKFLSISGYGVQARVEGKVVLVGTLKLMQEKKVDVTDIQTSMNTLLSEGKTLMILAVNGKVAGIIAAQDPVKPTAKLAIKRMQELGIQVAMLTGDNQQTADAIAKNLGIARVFAEVLPEDKAKYVKKLQEEGLFVAMVGDGVNDAPALAQADIGIAIGAGTDVAIETAKVVLMKSDPTDILRAIRLSKATIRKMKQNLAWASVYNVAAIPIAAGVLYPAFGITLRPEVSALLMSVSSIIVAVNAVLLKRSEKDLITV
jgi:Cu2+-exporting ATPase